ncbi:MAG: hypothetical protein GX410_11520, partial [Elusimicrobia bacterium]|nr:hypothetical protein [Elusimicrobiota bacterium]
FPGNTFLLFFPFSLGQLMATALVLTALLDYSESGNPWRLWLWTALGLLCHPLALFAPLLCLAIALLRPLNSMQKSVGAGAAAFFLLAGAITAADTWLSDPGQQAISLKNFAEFSARGIMPLQPFAALPSQKLYILAPLIAAATGYLGLRWLGRKQTLFLALAWAGTAMTPLLPLAIFGDGNLRNLIPEHNAYLLALAPSLALGMLLHAFWRRHRNLRWAPATAVLLAYAFTISQIPGQSKKLFREIWYWKAVTASYQSQPGFLNSRARALFQEGDSYEAIQTYKQALHTKKSGAAEAAESMSGLGEIALRLSMPNSAVIYFTAALKADPGNNRAKGLLARAYLPVKKRKTAEQLMKTAETPELLYQRGMLRLNLEEYNGAFSDFREACARDKAFCTAL